MVSKQYLDDYFTFLKFASVSTDSSYQKDVEACSDWLVEKLTSIGLKTEKHTTDGHPIIIAKNDHQPGRPTVMIYGHYDVQPVDPLELWDHPPFEPHLENDVVTARGATDNKGQILAHILGVETALKEKKELPVNLIFLIEGEEEIGSTNLLPFIKTHKEDLQCDIIVVSDTGMLEKGLPTFTYGLRGITGMEVTVTGPDKDLHSGIYGGAVANPITILSRLIASLHDQNEHVVVEGFYDDVDPLADWERSAWSQLPMTDKHLLELTGSPAPSGEKGFSSLERVWARPTAELNGIYGGYQGEGTKTVLPSQATAKLTFRLVPNQVPQKILDQVSAHLQKNCPPSVKLSCTLGHQGDPYKTDPMTGFGKAAQAALAETFPKKPVALIREGGSIPIVADFKSVLGVDTLLLGLALPDARCHSPNENFPLENFAGGIQLNQVLLEKLAAV